jgi:hypothetical protein
MNYYDLVLGLIPITLVSFTGLLTVSGFGLTTAVPVAAATAAGIVGHAMFVRTPTDLVGTPTEVVEPTTTRF